MCEEVFGHSEKFLKLSFQAEFFLQGQAGLKNTNCHSVKKNKFSFIERITTYLMFWRFLWMLNDWSWGFRIAQMHLDWIRFACLRSFNFFGGENIFANIFATFCMHLRNDVLSDFIQAGSQYHLDCKYLSSKIIRLCHHDHYLFIMM